MCLKKGSILLETGSVGIGWKEVCPTVSWTEKTSERNGETKGRVGEKERERGKEIGYNGFFSGGAIFRKGSENFGSLVACVLGERREKVVSKERFCRGAIFRERGNFLLFCVLQEEHGKSVLLEQQRSGDLEDQLRQQSVVSQISYVTVDNTCIQWELL